MNHCIRCYVSGKVQGVWFRGSTQTEALGLGLTGYARNLPDGRVEVVACGAPQALERLKSWLRRGPPMARVDHLTCERVEIPPPPDFTTR